MSKKAESENKEKKVIKYKKGSILKSMMFSDMEKDMLKVVLNEGMEYTMEDCKAMLIKEKARKVIE